VVVFKATTISDYANEKKVSSFCSQLVQSSRMIEPIVRVGKLVVKLLKVFHDQEKFLVSLLASVNKMLEDINSGEVKVEDRDSQVTVLCEVVMQVFKRRFQVLAKQELTKRFIEVS
jgi:hypothetical protein